MDADVNRNCPTLEELAEGHRCVVLAPNQPCGFLAEDGSCSIYPTRPNAWVGMGPGDDQSQEVRSCHGLAPLRAEAGVIL
jgi:hypothetical protein